MKHALAVFLVLLIVPFPVLAQERFVPQDTSVLDARVTFSGNVQATSALRDLNVSVYALPTSASSVDVSAPYTKEADAQGNERLVLQWHDVSSASYEVETRVSNRARLEGAKRVDFPYSPPRSVLKYLAPTPTSVVTPDVRGKALELTQGAENGFEAVTALSTWIHENVKYDIRYAGKYLDAQEVLNGKVGVCAEFTTLLVSMSRAAGIPARTVGGVIYGPDGNWNYHAWAEVYLDGWVPVDPTWNEIGWLDASHIDVGTFDDLNRLKTQINYTYTGARPTLQTTPVGVDVEVIRTEPMEKVFDVAAETYPNEIGIGDAAVVEVRTTTSTPGCIATSTEVTSSVDRDGNDVVEVTDPVTLAVCPGERSTAHFVLESKDVRSGFDSNTIGISRVAQIRPFLGNDIDVDLSVDFNDADTSDLDLVVDSATAQKGDRIGFEVRTNAGDYRVYSDLPMHGDYVTAERTGDHYIIAAASSGEVVRKEITVKENLPFKVTSVEKPQRVSCGDSFELTLTVQNLKDYFQDIDVRATASDELEMEESFTERVEKGETSQITIAGKVAEECSGADQVVSVSLGDQSVHETINVETAGSLGGGTAGGIFDAIASFLRAIADFLASLFS
ncbi:MAG: transglutaminase domain-containing protein [Candidatus Aenigmatarchaeota archaeon]|nr:MAG: transglutaminase domain-containing protein [Candidatus Aenigmarchaeota archaeon]